ncbi:MAG TPA: protein kinase, partial [Candidatus Limnocylindrales bacterium]|nr:protein kinase [Candidatus Limnocylindrales bacterium]
MDSEENIAREIWRQACVIASRKERDAFLSSACGVNPRLRSRVETMLKAEPDGGGPHEAVTNTGGPDSKTTMIVAASTGVPEGPGTVIGRYKLLERIGEGGFGAVYMAQQIEPINRRVALKIIKQGMDTEEVVARFDAERQALALMDHPNVARVLDGGATPSGRPYFVMELVTGLPITDFCDRNRLTTRERIDLFLAVCHAIQHAHSKGIVHRDLKPSNILVTMQEGLAVPKVIDFGLAKAMQTPLTDKTLFTRFGHMVGTPIYMSPEQLGGADVDTRSDVYSLGVILYELLTGKQPFDWQQLCAAGEREMWRVIEEEDPPPPSTRLTRLGQELAAVAQHRNVSPRRLSELVRGDLDWITMKALQKNRSHRYATPLALAEDLQRHLDHQPVSAGPPRFGYRAWKFARRHRYAVTASAGIVISLVAGLIFATMGFLRAREQRERALLAEHHAEQQRQIAFSEAQRARSNETQARQISYASDMALASHALDISNLGRVLPLLRRHLPVAGAEDLRNWEWRYLWQQCRSGELFQLANVSNSIVSIAVSRDGRLVAIADLSGQTAVYDLPARALLWSTNASPNIALSPDGKVLADGTGQIRDAETGVILNRLPVEESIKRLAFSPDGTCLAGLVGRDHLCLWRSNDWKLTATYKGFPSASLLFGKMAFFTCAERIAIGTEDGRVRIAELRDGRIRHDWQAHTESISALALAPDARFLATGAGYSDNEIKLWRPEDGALAGTLRGHRAWVIALAFSPDGALLASASADQTICLWDMHTQELVARLRGHLFEVWGVTFHPDGKTLFSADKEGAVKCWRVPLPKSNSSQTELQLNDFGFAESVTSEFAFTPDGRELLTLDSTTGKVRRRILPSLKSLGEIEPLGTNNYMVASSPKLRLAASLDRDGCLKVWDFDKEVVQTNCAVGASAGRRAWVGFAPGNRRLIAVVDYRTVMQWELTPWKQVGNWTFNERVFGPFSVSPDGRFLANGGNSLVVYSLANGTILKRIQANRLTTDVVAFSPDGSWLASGSQEGVAKVWRTGSWQEVGTLRGHLLGVHGLAFSADGRRLVTGSSGNETAK